MSWVAYLGVLAGTLALFLASGMWTAFALMLAGVVVVYIYGGAFEFQALGAIGWNSNTDTTLTAVPLFILMGQILMAGRISADFFGSLSQWLRRIPGSLLPGSIVACAVFAATTGTSVATAAAVGSVAIPEMKQRNYRMSFAAGTLAAGGTLGILLPPSIVMILYSSLENVPLTSLFAAGLIPGILMAVLFIVYIMIRGTVNPTLVGEQVEGVTTRQRIRGSARMLPVLLLICFVIGSIYKGIATPTEAAALGVVGSLIVSAGRISIPNLYRAFKASIETTIMVLSILMAAQVIAFALVTTGVSTAFTSWVIGNHLSRDELLIAIFVIYILLGDFVEGIGMMLMTMPVLFPIVIAAGINPVWFGVVMAILIELGQITPPVGLNLFVIRSFDKSLKHGEVIRAALPYAGLMIVMLVMLTLFPNIALWLPSHTNGSVP